MTVRLPASMRVIERGWLSANNILMFDGDTATLVDSGYVTHAPQTLALVGRALNGHRLARLVNTHSHSDHIGGNSALKAAHGCDIYVPAGLAATIADWDEDALLLSPLGQQAARFQHDFLTGAGDEMVMGDLLWQALAVPGHDMAALAWYNAEEQILISGDALWEHGFGVIFPELLGEADGLAHTRRTLEMLGRLSLRTVIPGHGAPFDQPDVALERAFRRLTTFEDNIDSLAWHAIKVIVAFGLLERQSIPRSELAAFLDGLAFARDVNDRYLGLTMDTLAARVTRDLLAVGALRMEDGLLLGRR